MANITPVQIWFKGLQHQANIFTLYSNGDNLLDAATFQYQLIEEIIIPEHEEYVNGIVVIIPEKINSQTLLMDELSINGENYALWDAEIDANAWIYQWAAIQLNLVIL